MAAEPLGGPSTGYSWHVSLGQGRLEEARRRLAALYSRGAPADYLLVIALNESNRDEIKSLLAAQDPTDVSTRALYTPVLRDFNSREAVLGTLRAVQADTSTRWPSKYHDVALMAAYFGDAEFALQTIENDSRNTSIRLQALWYPLMSDARRLPAFKDLVSDINLVAYWRAYGWPDACQPLGGDEFSCE